MDEAAVAPASKRRPRAASRQARAAALALLVTAAPSRALAAEIVDCQACDAPDEHALSFCRGLVPFSACLRPGSTWRHMDAKAETAYKQQRNATTAADAGCERVLQRIECLRVFSVCELGTPELLCRASCIESISSNCSASLTSDEVPAVQTTYCGANSTSSSASKALAAIGIADGDAKCFNVSYAGPRHSAWVAGFTIAVVFSFLASVGINLQKRALKQSEAAAVETNKEPIPPYRLPLWLVGFVLILLGSVLDFVAFGLAPQSLLAPLAALTLVWNMILAPCFNKEKLSRNDIIATLVIFTGATLAVVFASHTSPSYNLDMLLRLYRDPVTCTYFVIVGLCILLHFMLIQFVEKLSLMSRRHRLIQIGRPSMWSTVRLVGYSGFAGTMGGQSVLFAKSCAEMFKAAFHGDGSCFLHFEGYLLMFALLAFLLCQFHYLNLGLSYYDALSIVPVYQAYWIISGVLGGVIYFQEIRSFSFEQACMFIVGIITTIVGVVLLSRRKHTGVAKRKAVERGYSFSGPSAPTKSDSGKPLSSSGGVAGPLPPVAEVSSQAEDATDTEGEDHHALTVHQGDEAIDLSTTEESDESADGDTGSDDDGTGEHQQTVNRQAIDNYLDMSTTACLTEIFGGLGFQSAQSSSLLYRRPSARGINGRYSPGRRTRRSVDDIEVGLPTASLDGASARERAGGKRRSITFTSYWSSLSSAKKDSLAAESSEKTGDDAEDGSSAHDKSKSSGSDYDKDKDKGDKRQSES